VSPLLAAPIAARSEPLPTSLMLVTVSVLSMQRSSNASSCGRQVARWRGDACERNSDERFPYRSQDEDNMVDLLEFGWLSIV
jgi:hypothetical protein